MARAHKRQRDIDALLANDARPIESADELLIEAVFPSDDEAEEFNRAVREWRDHARHPADSYSTLDLLED